MTESMRSARVHSIQAYSRRAYALCGYNVAVRSARVYVACENMWQRASEEATLGSSTPLRDDTHGDSLQATKKHQTRLSSRMSSDGINTISPDALTYDVLIAVPLRDDAVPELHHHFGACCGCATVGLQRHRLHLDAARYRVRCREDFRHRAFPPAIVVEELNPILVQIWRV